MQCNETAQTRSKSLLERHALDRSYRFITRYIVSEISSYDDIVSAACSRCVVGERFSPPEGFVRSIHIA